MATYYFLNTGNTNWGVSTNWSTSSGGPGNGSVPTLSDDTIFDTNSGNCTVDTTNRECKSINFTNYGATISMIYVINTYGDVTLGASMGITGSAQLNVNETSTLTSNGKTWSSDFTFGGNAKTFTLSDDWAVLGIVRIFSGGNTSINSRTFSCLSDLTVSGVYGDTRGTTLFKLAGNGTWSHTISPTAYLRNDVTIDTPGTISFGANILWGQGTLTHVTGSVVTTGNTLNTSGIGGTFNCSNIQFNNMTLGGGVHTVVGNLDINGLFYINTSSVVNSGNILLGGSVIIQNSRKLTGSTNIVMDGTGTIDMGTANYDENIGISGTFSVNTTGTLTIGSNCKIEADNVIYVTGSVVYNGPLYFQRGYNRTTTQNITWTHKATGAGLAFIGSGVHNLLSNIDCDTDLFVGMLSNTTIIDGYQINIGRSFTCNSTSGVVRGTTKFVLDGTGTVSSIYIGAWRNNTEINTSGTITFTGSVYYDTGTFSYVSGNVITTGSTLRIGANTNLDTNGITWSNAVLGIGLQTITFLSNFNATGNVSSLNNNNVWNGATVSVGGNLTTTTSGQGTGTSKIVLNGSGFWEGSFGNNIDINTSGYITFSSVGCGIGCGTLRYISGSVSAHPSNLFWIKLCGTITLNNCGNFNFQNILQEGNTVLTNDINVLGNYSTNYNITLNGGTVSVGGSLYIGQLFSGNSTFRMIGTGTWSGAGTLLTDLTIDTTGQIGISGTVRYATRTLKYISGTVSTSGSTLNLVGSSTLDTGASSVQHPNGLPWNNVSVTTNSTTITLNSNLLVNGLFSSTGTSVTFIGGNFYNCYGGVYIAYNTGGVNPSQFNLYGGTWTGGGVGQVIRNRVNIYGDCSIINTVSFTDIRHYSGTVTTTGSTLRISEGNYIETSGMTWSNVSLVGNCVTTLGGNLNISGILLNTGVSGLDGNFNINCSGGITNNNSLYPNTVNAPTLNLISGTWSATGYVYLNMNIGGGNSNVSGTVYFGTYNFITTLTYTGVGSVNTSGSTLYLNTSVNLDTDRGGGNKITWSNIVMTNTITVTLLSDLTCNTTSLAGPAGGNILTMNGSKFYIGGNVILTNGGPQGTTDIVLNGNTTVTSVGTCFFATNLEINTSGTIDLGTVAIGGVGKTLLYTNGTVSNTGTVALYNGTTVNTGINCKFNYLTLSGVAATFTFSSDVYVKETLYTAFNNQVINGNSIYIRSLNIVGTAFLGTTNIVFNSTGTWSGTGVIYNNLTVNTPGTLAISGTVQVSGINSITPSTLTYTAGTVITTGSTLRIYNSYNLDTDRGLSGRINWNDITFQNNFAATFTLPSDLTVSGILYFYSNNFFNTTFNGSNINAKGDIRVFYNSCNITGNTNLLINGTGSQTWEHQNLGTGAMSLPVVINCFYLTIKTATVLNSITYTSGTVSHTGTLRLGNATLDTTRSSNSYINWGDISVLGGLNILTEFFSSGTMSVTSNNSYAFTGSSGFNVSRLITTSTTNTSLRTITYQSGVTYSVRDSISLISSTNANRLRFISSSSGNRAIFILGKDATQNIGYVNATDIDSNSGQTIWSFGSVLSNTLNWNDLDARSAGGSSTFIH